MSASNTRELKELNHKLARLEKDASLLKKQIEVVEATSVGIEKLRSKLKTSWQEAEQQRAAAEKDKAELVKE